ncbi:MAG: ATP synthase beta subunit C-terminal domain-containing protein, partial [Angustibacter sp.]
LDVAAQLLSALARARQVHELAELVGEGALGATDRLYLRFADAGADVLVAQRVDERRTLDDTLDRAWRALSQLPRQELAMLSSAQLDERYRPGGPRGAGGAGGAGGGGGVGGAGGAP